MSGLLLSILMAAAPANTASPGPRTVDVTVTDKGFEPDEIKVKKGESVKLVITRKTDATCAKQITIADAGIFKKPLPLNQAVEVIVTPKKDGEIRYACGMDMLSGVLLVE